MRGFRCVHGSRGALMLPLENAGLESTGSRSPETQAFFINMKEHKRILREEALRNRARMDIGNDHPENAVPLFFDAIKPVPAQIISFYVPIEREFNCWPLIEAAAERGNPCALPILQKGTREMLFGLWTERTEMLKGRYGIFEPAHTPETLCLPDIVVVPLLAFDRRGYRLGMGGGYYDTTLESLRRKKSITAVGVAYSQQACLFNLPAEEHDQKMDWVITPQGAHYFGG